MGFYHRAEEWEEEEIIEKCIERLTDRENDPNTIKILYRETSKPAEFLEEKFLNNSLFVNHTENGAELDIEYTDLNKKSKREVRKNLIQNRGKFYVISATVKTDSEEYTVNALVEIRGTITGNNTEFYIEDFYEGELENIDNGKKKGIKEKILNILPF